MPEPQGLHPAWLKIGADFVTIDVVARPGSQRRGLLRVEPRGLVIGLASPAEKGKANEDLMAFVADIAGVARRDVSMLRGTTSRNKVLRIASSHPSATAGRIVVASRVAKQK